MAAVRMVKCKYCGKQFNRNAEPCIEVSSRRYAHKSCAEQYLNSISKDEKDYLELEKYIKKLFGLNVLTAKIKRQIKEYKEEYDYSYSGIQKTLYWWFEVRKNSLEKANDGIGIVPYVYDECKNYYYRLYLAKTANEIVNNTIPKAQIQEIEIGSPRVHINPPKLFKFGEEKHK